MLKTKVTLVTGAGSGIGRAVALAYAREGASVVVADANSITGEETVSQIRAIDASAIFAPVDVADPDSCRCMVDLAIAEFGRLDVACNNAGIAGTPDLTADYDLSNWQHVINVNLSGVFYCMRYESAAMLRAGGGSIVNIASVLGAVGLSRAPAYVASKHGVVGLTKATALDYAANGIRINAVGPGFVETPLIAKRTEDPQARQQVQSWHPMGRLGQAEEVAELVLWLSSPKAGFVTGSYYPIDGGYLAR